MNGYSVKYFRVTKFLETMNAEQAVGNYLKSIDKMAKTQLLILDDLVPNRPEYTIFDQEERRPVMAHL